jgi:S-adenosyl-L-methionine hydrolase (adenosine-forming)
LQRLTEIKHQANSIHKSRQINENASVTATVTLLTDFGSEDSYVGEMKARLLEVIGIRLIDLTHGIPPFDIAWGAFQLFRSYHYFPKGTWHLAVVDPGVGSKRACLYVRTKSHHFVGPDNGLLNWAVEDCEHRDKQKAQVFEIPVPSGSSATFHGRDVFAPFITRCLTGKAKFSLARRSLGGSAIPRCRVVSGRWEGVVLGKDHFGNVVTSIPVRGGPVEARLGAKRYLSAQTYDSIPVGKIALIAGSHGFWELACRGASAWEKLRLKAGTPIELKLR